MKHRYHRVGRVLNFFSSRRNWDSPNPSPTGECAPLRFWGEGHTSWRERGWGESQFRRGDIHCGTLSIYCTYLVISTVDEIGTVWVEYQNIFAPIPCPPPLAMSLPDLSLSLSFLPGSRYSLPMKAGATGSSPRSRHQKLPPPLPSPPPPRPLEGRKERP